MFSEGAREERERGKGEAGRAVLQNVEQNLWEEPKEQSSINHTDGRADEPAFVAHAPHQERGRESRVMIKEQAEVSLVAGLTLV